MNDFSTSKRIDPREDQLHRLVRISEAFRWGEGNLIAYGQVLDAIKEVLDCSSCSIHLTESKKRYVYLVASKGVPDSIPDSVVSSVRIEFLDEAYMLPLREGRAYRPLEFAKESDQAGISAANNKLAEGMVKIPLLARDELMGVLTIIKEQASAAWLESQQEWLTTIGHHLGTLVEQAVSFEKIRGEAVLLERERVSQELHDNLSQCVGAIRLLTELVYENWQAGKLDRMDSDLAMLNNFAHDAYANIRDEMLGLRFVSQGDEDVIAKIREYLVVFQRQWGIKATLTIIDPDGTLGVPQRDGVQLFRIIQEALSNVQRHAYAEHVEVTLETAEGILRMLVIDDGVGFNPKDVPAGKLGISIMKERSAEIGARVCIISSEGEGTIVRIELPFATTVERKAG